MPPFSGFPLKFVIIVIILAYLILFLNTFMTIL